MGGRFEIRPATGGKLYFVLKAANGEIILVGGKYSTLAACQKGIMCVKRACVAAKIEDQTLERTAAVTNPKFEIYSDEKGGFRFRLKARNGEVIASGESYRSKANCIKGIESIMRNAPEAEVVTIK